MELIVPMLWTQVTVVQGIRAFRLQKEPQACGDCDCERELSVLRVRLG